MTITKALSRMKKLKLAALFFLKQRQIFIFLDFALSDNDIPRINKEFFTPIVCIVTICYSIRCLAAELLKRVCPQFFLLL